MNTSKIVFETLRTWHRQQAGELLSRLGVSRPTLMRAITELDGQVVSRGRARRTAYAARRSIRGRFTVLPLFLIDTEGRAHEAGVLDPVYPNGCAMTFTGPFSWPLDDEMSDGWFRGLPYPLADMRPQGFLGRNFAHQFSELLQVNEDVKRWDEDDVLHVLSVCGSDQPGNYILGETALRSFLDEQQRDLPFLSDAEIEQDYPLRALQALNFGDAGSSVAGEFPKFTARRFIGVHNIATHVIVKFSGSDGSVQEQRWADLLVCEHLALNTITDTLGLPAAQSRIYQFAGRTFYEVDRFDRHGKFGRSGVCSWSEINAALFGGTGSWSEGSAALLKMGHISENTAQQIQLLEQFGRLIANTDMHDGNLSFLPMPNCEKQVLTLAPAYDMLPMWYAPQRGVELTERKFAPVLPIPRERSIWLKAVQAALTFWRKAGNDERISTAFRAIARCNADLLMMKIADVEFEPPRALIEAKPADYS